jgi:hypothetical protein
MNQSLDTALLDWLDSTPGVAVVKKKPENRDQTVCVWNPPHWYDGETARRAMEKAMKGER